MMRYPFKRKFHFLLEKHSHVAHLIKIIHIIYFSIYIREKSKISNYACTLFRINSRISFENTLILIVTRADGHFHFHEKEKKKKGRKADIE